MPTPLPTIADIFLVTQVLTNADELHDFNNVFCVKGSFSTMTDADVAAAVAEAYQDALLPVIAESMVMGDTKVIRLDGSAAQAIFTTASAGATGGHSAGNAMPNACSQVLTWRTGIRGRSHRGRTYLPGVKSDMVTDIRIRNLTSTQHTALAAAGAAFLAQLADPEPVILELHVFSRHLSATTKVQASSANVGVCEQRRRYERVAHR